MKQLTSTCGPPFITRHMQVLQVTESPLGAQSDQQTEAHQHIPVPVHDEAGRLGIGECVPHPPIVVDELLVRHPLRAGGLGEAVDGAK